MKKFLHSHHGASKGAALIIVLAFVVLATALGLTYFSRTTTDRQLAQSSSNDTTADLVARSALDIVVSNFKQEILAAGLVTQSNIQPQRSGDDASIPNLIRRSVRNDQIPPPGLASLASSVSSTSTSGNSRSISTTRWNSHYLVPLLDPTGTNSTPVSSFVAPDWVLLTAQGPNPAPAAANAVIGRYAFAVYDEGGLIDINLGGVPTYANLTLPARPARRLAKKYPSEESEIMEVTCQGPDFDPQNVGNITVGTGTPVSLGPYPTNHRPVTSYTATWLPRGLSINPSTGIISGIPTSPGTFNITLLAYNACGPCCPGLQGTLNLTIYGFPSPDSTPWPVNKARKGTVAFADLTTLPSTPSVTTTQINKLMGWRNYATTQQPSSASFDNPSFPLPEPDTYARYFLGATLPFTTPFTTVSTAVVNNRTDQAAMSRQELIKLQKSIGFMPSVLQYLGTFSRALNRPAPNWPGLTGALASARWDMNNLALVIPDSWIVYPGGHGGGHAWGLQRRTEFYRLFGLLWVEGTFNPNTRLTDPNYWGHWKYDAQHKTLSPLPATDPDFFQIIDYAMNQAIGVTDPNHVLNTFTVGAAIIDQYDTDDLVDPPPGQIVPPGGSPLGNTITIIDPYGTGNPANYVYGVEGMSYDPPDQNVYRPAFAPGPGSPPLPPNYALLNRRFENVGEFGYAYSPASSLGAKTLDFASATSRARAMLDFFTYNTASQRAGIVNLNTRNGPVLASIIRGAWLHDPGTEVQPPNPSYLVSPDVALAAGQAIVQETTSTGLEHGPALNRADVARLATAANVGTSNEAKEVVARALAEAGQTRTWNLMIDVIAQTGKYALGTTNLSDPTKFIVQGEKRYWLHIALNRDDGTVLGTQLEEVVE